MNMKYKKMLISFLCTSDRVILLLSSISVLHVNNQDILLKHVENLLMFYIFRVHTFKEKRKYFYCIEILVYFGNNIYKMLIKVCQCCKFIPLCY